MTDLSPLAIVGIIILLVFVGYLIFWSIGIAFDALGHTLNIYQQLAFFILFVVLIGIMATGKNINIQMRR